MKSKKLLAMALAATMVAGSSFTAFAADAPSAISSASGAASGDTAGSISTIKKDVISVIIPTTVALDFVMDPQGLLGMTGDTATLDSLSDSAGYVVGKSAVGIINRSSKPIEMSVALKVTDSDSSTATSFVATKDAAVGTAATTSKKMCLYALPSSVNAYKEGADVAANYQPGSTALTLKTTDQTLKFALDAATYYVKRTGNADAYTYDYSLAEIADNGVGAAIRLGGYINPKADWSDYTKATSPSTIKVTAVFSYDSTPDLSAVTVANSYGFAWEEANITSNNAALLQLSSRCKTASAEFDKKSGAANNKDIVMDYELFGDETLESIWVLALDGTTWADVLNDAKYASFVSHDDKTHKFTIKKDFLTYYATGENVKVWFQFKTGEGPDDHSILQATNPSCVIKITDSTTP